VALNGRAQSVKVSHRSVFEPEAVKHQMGISVSAWDEFMYGLKTLSERKVKQPEVEMFMRSLFQPSPEQVEKKANERAMGKVLAMFEGEGRGSNLASSAGTAYGLLNAVTEFVDHERQARSTDNRLDSAWFGQGAALKQKALEQAIALAA